MRIPGSSNLGSFAAYKPPPYRPFPQFVKPHVRNPTAHTLERLLSFKWTPNPQPYIATPAPQHPLSMKYALNHVEGPSIIYAWRNISGITATMQAIQKSF